MTMTAPARGQPAFLVWAAAGFGAELVKLNTVAAPADESPGKRPTEAAWQTLAVTPDLVSSWARDSANVGVRTRYFPAVDVDVDDDAIASLVERTAELVAGKTARRTRSNSARRALLFRVEGAPFTKSVLKFKLPGGTFAKVEVLADGQQLAVAGMHPSGVPNEWPDGQPEAVGLATLTAGRRDELLAVLRARLEAAGCVFEAKRAEPRPAPRIVRSEAWSDVEELVEESLARLDPDLPYDEWLAVGMALHAKEPDSAGPAFYAWDGWSSRGQKYPGQDELEKKWRTFKVGGGVNFGSLLAMAGVSGSRHATRLPEPVESETTSQIRDVKEEAAPERKGIPLIRACDAVEKPVEWVVENFLAKGELTDLSGDPGVGKGGITASWAAQVTRENPTATVIFFATEDPLGRVKARLRAEGADLSRVWFLDITQANASPILPGDIAQVEAIVRSCGALLLILDPALEFMQSDLDSHKQQDVARFMGPLLGIAQRTGAAVLTVRHLNKSGGSSALYRASGSIGFTGKVRIALLASKDDDTGSRALATTKNNLGRDKHTVGYDVISKGDSSVIAWGEALATSADALVNQEPGKKKRGPAPAKLEAACDAVRGMLAAGPMKIDDVLRCAKSAGISRTLAYEAKDAVRAEKCTLERSSAWRLPKTETPDGLLVELQTTPDNSGRGV